MTEEGEGRAGPHGLPTTTCRDYYVEVVSQINHFLPSLFQVMFHISNSDRDEESH